MASSEGAKLTPGTENEDDSAISMLDVLEEQQELEENANAVLGDSDDRNCTYIMGYIPRQAIYACATCVGPASDPAGICLACSYECHEGHELFELYTKRNFRCDCGNSKFPADFKCKLMPQKSANNEENSYNQNFKGAYCTCHRPYPDPEDHVEDEMIQCAVCEDWYHGRHLKGSPLCGGDFEEMTCQGCMTKHDFLGAYAVHSVVTKVVKAETTEKLEVETTNAVKDESDKEQVSQPPVETPESVKNAPPNGENQNQTSEMTDVKKQAETLVSEQESSVEVKNSENERKTEPPSEEKENCDTESMETGDKAETPGGGSAHHVNGSGDAQGAGTPVAGSSVQAEGAGSGCKLEELRARNPETKDCASFWKQGWRSKLCLCENCKKMYVEQGVAFLTDLSDSVQAYEDRGKAKQKPSTQYERGMEALSGMERLQQVEVLTEYHDLQSNLKEYLKKFAENKKVVRKEDIQEFFSGLQARKKQRTGINIPYHCK